MAIQGFTLAIFFALASVFFAANLPSDPIITTFWAPLIHRDASNSPWYDPKLSHDDRIKSAIARSIARAKLLFKDTTKSSSARNANLNEIISTGGEYFINISIGTPSFSFLAMIDMCSKDNWLECKFHEDRIKQNPSLFDPLKSSTFRPTLLPSNPIFNIHELYAFYGPNTELNFQETITSDNLEFPNLNFDCKFTNQGTFGSIGSGVIGLLLDNQRPNVTRLQNSIDGKFSYCLLPFESNDSKKSVIHFGEYGVVHGDNIVSTPIVMDGNVTKSVKLTLKAITVGEKRIEWNIKPKVGNIIIDIGTTLLMLQSVFYDAVESEIRNQVNTTRIDDPFGQLKLCYKLNGFKPPKLIMNFNGANVELNEYNVWVSTSKNVICFAAAPSNITIFGNLAQRNFLIGHDMKESTVYFSSENCKG